MEAKRTRVSAPHEQLPDEVLPGEVISIQAVAEDRIVGNWVTHLPIEVIEKNPYQTRYVFDEDMLVELRDSIKEQGWCGPHRGAAGGRGRALHSGFGRAAIAGFEDGREGVDPGPSAPAFAAAGGGDDGAGEYCSGGFESDRAGGGVRGAEPGVQVDAVADCAAGWGVAGDGGELHAAVAAAAVGDGVSVVGTAELQRCAGDFAAGE